MKLMKLAYITIFITLISTMCLIETAEARRPRPPEGIVIPEPNTAVGVLPAVVFGVVAFVQNQKRK